MLPNWRMSAGLTLGSAYALRSAIPTLSDESLAADRAARRGPRRPIALAHAGARLAVEEVDALGRNLCEQRRARRQGNRRGDGGDALGAGELAVQELAGAELL